MAPMRITGMASGLDTQQMVDDLMRVERTRHITPLDRNKQLNIWKREAYQAFTKDMAELMVKTQESLGLSHYGQVGALLNRDVSTYDWAKVARSSNKDIATATATSDAIDGNMKVKIEKLAEGIKKYSKTQLKNSEGTLTSSSKMSEIPGADGKFTHTETVGEGADAKTREYFEVTINGETFKAYKDESIKSFTDRINSNDDVGVKLNFMDGRFTLSTKGTGSNRKIEINSDEAGLFLGTDSLSDIDLEDKQVTLGGTVLTKDMTVEDLFKSKDSTFTWPKKTDGVTDETLSIKIDGRTIEIEKGTTIDQLMTKINKIDPGTDDEKASGIELTLTDGRFSLSSTDNEAFVIEDSLGLFTGSDSASKLNLEDGKEIKGSGLRGQDAVATIDGLITVTSSTNNIKFNGVTVKANTTGEINITTEPNVDEVYNKIKNFVDEYNKIVDKMNKAVAQKKDKSYNPLTDEERKELSEDQAKQWDERAKEGILYRDSTLTSINRSMRTHLYQPVYNDYGNGVEEKAKISMITDVGISTGKYTDKGKLVIDEKKLKDAIEKDTEGVLNLLFKPPGSDVNLDDSVISKMDDKDKREETMKAKYNEMGVFNRLLSDMTTGIKKIVDIAGPGEEASTLREIKSNFLIDFVTKKGGAVADIDKTIEEIVLEKYNEERRLNGVENNLWRKYSQLEKTMQKLNDQSQWLQSQLAGL